MDVHEFVGNLLGDEFSEGRYYSKSIDVNVDMSGPTTEVMIRKGGSYIILAHSTEKWVDELGTLFTSLVDAA